MKVTVRSAVSAVHDAVRTQLWPIPTLGVVVAVILGVLVPHLDAQVDGHLPALLDSAVFSGDASAGRTVLDAVASSLITVTSLTFSLTVVTLQLASSQFSPRLLRTFTQDIFVQITLAIFLATFTFSLTVLRSVRSSQDSASPFVPRLAVTSSFLLAIASVIGLVLFLAHLTRQIRVETMLRHVHEDADDTLRNNLERRDESEGRDANPGLPPEGARVLWADRSGFLLRIDQGELVRAARSASAQIMISRHPGTFVVEGTPLGSIWAEDRTRLADDSYHNFAADLGEAIHLGTERTAAQDVGYGLRQLVDVINKALSPGINDPTTAIHGLGHVSGLLTTLTDYTLRPLVVRDDHDVARVVLDRPDFAHYLDLALTQPRAYGAADTEVLARLYHLLADVAWHARAEHRQPVLDQLSRLDVTAADQGFDEVEFGKLHQLSQAVREVFAHPEATVNRPAVTASD